MSQLGECTFIHCLIKFLSAGGFGGNIPSPGSAFAGDSLLIEVRIIIFQHLFS